MNKEELKVLSDQTFYDNNNGGIQPSAHRNFNNHLIDSLPVLPPDKSQFTYIVDSNEALAAWASNTAGNDYTAVLVKKGTWSVSSIINLTTTGTKVVVGMTGAELLITASRGLVYNTPLTANDTADYLLAGLEISCSGESSSLIACLNIPVMYNCVINVAGGRITGVKGTNRMINCTVVATNPDNIGTAVGLEACTDIINSAVTVRGATVTGYSNCERLVNCSGYTAPTIKGIVFSACKFLTNCRASDQLGRTDIMFDNCSQLLNCTALPNTQKNNSTVAFNGCEYLTGCKADTGAIGSSNALYYECLSLNGCSVVFNIGTSSTGFKSCYQLFGCSVVANNIGTSGPSIGCFHSCKIMFGCRAQCAEQVYAFRSCYMTVMGTDAVNETFSGGCNNYVPL